MESVLENKLLSSYKEEMVLFLKSHLEYFEEAIQLAISDKQPYSWRAAFLLFDCMEENDERLIKHVKTIVDSIKSKKDGHQRELLKILLKMNVKKKYEGQLFDLCVNIWEQIDKDPSVRITALKMIIKIIKKYPELAEEVKVLTQDHFLESLSPGVKRSVDKLIKEVIM